MHNVYLTDDVKSEKTASVRSMSYIVCAATKKLQNLYMEFEFRSWSDFI